MNSKENIDQPEERAHKRERFFYPILSSILSMAVLFLSLTAVHQAIFEDGTVLDSLKIFMAAIFLVMGIGRVPLALREMRLTHSLFGFIKNLALAGVFTVLGILFSFLPITPGVYAPLFGVYLFALAANRVGNMIEKRRLSSYIFDGFLTLLFLFLSFIVFFGLDQDTMFAMLTLFLAVIMTAALLDTLAFAFSSIQLKGILKIIRKTYALEILYGMVVLILSCSYYFTITEDSIVTYADGLWYSFAVVTTIGFGDFTVTTPIGRILSVILGIYGIIVVAVITSIIINYYNDTKDSKSASEGEAVEEKKDVLPEVSMEPSKEGLKPQREENQEPSETSKDKIEE